MAINPNKQGSGYINVRNYLQANPNVNLGKKIADQYGNELGLLDKSFQGAKDQFSQDINKANVNTEENRAKRDSILTNPEQAVADPNQVTEFNKFLSPSFAAPKTTNLESAVGNTSSMTRDLVNPAYKTNLLQRYYGQTPQNAYSTGQKTLDNVFLNNQQSANALGDSRRGALQQLGRQKSNLAGMQEEIRSAKGQTDQFGKDTQSQVNSKIGEYVDETKDTTGKAKGILADRLNTYNTNKGLFNTEIDTAFNTGEFNKDLADRLGLNEGQSLYGLKGDQFYDTNNYTLSNVATDAERARVGALSKLKGDATPLDVTQNILTDQSKYGAIDKNKIASYMTDAQRKVQDQTNAAGLNLETPEYFADMQSSFNPTSGYQYTDQLKPLLTKSLDIKTVGQGDAFMKEANVALQSIRSQWKDELKNSNPTERKRANMDQFLKTWQNQLNKINSTIMNKRNEVSNQLSGNKRVKLKAGV